MINDPKNGTTLRVGILGAGGIAETHAEVLRRIEGVDLVGICDLQVAKANTFRDRMRLPAAYSNLDAMIAEAKPDIVHLAVSPVAHAATALTCLNAGVSVFVEKPFCLSAAECAQVTAAAERTLAKIGVNHNLLFHPAVERAIQVIRAGKLGALEHATFALYAPLPELAWGPYSHWLFQNGTNLMFELGVHPLSVLYCLFGRVLQAQTMRANPKILSSGVEFYSCWQVALRCERGTATLLLSVASGFQNSWLHIQGEDGACHVDLRRNTVLVSEKSQSLRPNDDLRDSLRGARALRRQGLAHYKNYLLASLQRKVPYPTQYASMDGSIRAFYDALRRGVRPPVGAPEGTAVVEACELAVRQFVSVPAVNIPQHAAAEYAEVAGMDEVLVIGGAGFLGSHLVRMLRENGNSVRVFSRNAGKGRKPEPGLRYVQGAISDAEAVSKAVEGVQVVYDLAANPAGTWDETRKAYVEGAQNVAEACLKHGVRRLIYASTTAVLDWTRTDTIDESAGTDPQAASRPGYYHISKIVVEKLLTDMHAQRGLPVVILRPAIIVGKGGQLCHSGIGAWRDDTCCTIAGKGTNPLPFVLVEDVAAAFFAAKDAPDVAGRTFNLAGDVRPSALEMVRYMRERSRRDFRAYPQSLVQMYAMLWFKYLMKVAVGKQGDRPSWLAVKCQTVRTQLDCSAAKKLLGWKPVSDLETFLREAVDPHLRPVDPNDFRITG